MAEELEGDPNVGFLYKAMLERDPQKRKVKPVQKHMLQLDFGGLGDSSDDSDFQLSNNDSEASETSEGEDGEDGGSKDSESEEGSDDDDDVEEEEEEEVELGVLIQRAKSQGLVGLEDSASSATRLKVLICCVCMGESSGETEEIVECDGCGVCVHEGCYGITDTQSMASTESSASTEPWFCDSCKAGLQPSCELCPNSGGIYKETDAGRWVHIVCAMYIPGVAFGDVDKLSPVTLFEMPYSKWGAKECCFCEDDRFSRTGVCIGCDAGMCRNYFHVTCAQKEGLLSEASPDEDIADPFYAYCKQHAEKNSARTKKRNWLAIQSHAKNHKRNRAEEDTDQARVERKLNRHREKYKAGTSKRPPSWESSSAHTTFVPTEKMPRMLTSCPSAVRRLMKKAELLGVNVQQAQHTVTQKDIRKKWHVAPAFSVEFVSYYFDRNIRMNNMKAQVRELLSQREKLQEQESLLREKYDLLTNEVSMLGDEQETLQEEGEQIWSMLSEMFCKDLKRPAILSPKKIRAQKQGDPSTELLIHQCALCKKSHNQHLLAKCDACRLHYHLGCLDPPLSRMPKKSKLFTWHCSECVSSSEEESEKKDADAPRRLREKIKEPSKFTPPLIRGRKSLRRDGKKKKRRAKKKLVKMDEDPVGPSTGTKTSPTILKTPYAEDGGPVVVLEDTSPPAGSAVKKKVVKAKKEEEPIVIEDSDEMVPETVTTAIFERSTPRKRKPKEFSEEWEGVRKKVSPNSTKEDLETKGKPKKKKVPTATLR